MASRSIAKMGHPILSKVATQVSDPTAPDVKAIVQDMIDTMTAVQACGISAPQIFESQRIFTYRLTKDRIPPDSSLEPIDWTTMINPIIAPEADEKVAVWERCLSIPDLHGKVMRYPKITVTYQTLLGKTECQYAEGWLAALLQHELDHLDGYLYPMRMNDLSLLEFNVAPGRLESDLSRMPQLDPLFRRMVEDWQVQKTPSPVR